MRIRTQKEKAQHVTQKHIAAHRSTSTLWLRSCNDKVSDFEDHGMEIQAIKEKSVQSTHIKTGLGTSQS
jgi:hypothetical protein